MTNAAIRRIAGAAVAALIVAVGATVSVPPAHADPVYDQNFIDYLNQSGVPFKNRTDAILTAEQFCLDMSRQGGTTYQAANNLMKQEGLDAVGGQELHQGGSPDVLPGGSTSQDSAS
jgi:hypothetical protein